MTDERIEAEGRVSGNQANIPARIRRHLGIDDGDRLRWLIQDDGSLRVEVVPRRTETFAEFDGYDGPEETEVVTDHDAWGSSTD